MSENTVWLLKTRYTDLSMNLRASWDIYIRFYTVFLTFNMAALAWALSDAGTRSHAVRLVASVFAIQTTLTAITSVFMAFYSRGTVHAQAKIEAILESAPEGILVAPVAVSVIMTAWAGVANFAAMIGMAGLWVYVAVMRG